MQLTTLLVLTSLGSVIGSVKEKTFVRKNRNRVSAPMLAATLASDGQVDIAKAPSLAPLALGFTTPDGYFKLDFGADQSACGSDPIGSEMECKHGAQAIGIDMEQGMWMGESPWWHDGVWQGIPRGCWVLGARAYWNNNNPTNTSVEHNDIPSNPISAHALDPVKRSKAQATAAATAATTATAAATAATTANCPTSLGPVEQHDGKSWAKVVNILNDRAHGDTGSTNNKLSDAQINSLRGSGLLRFVCDGIVKYVSDTEAFDSTAAVGLYKCGSSPTGPFATSGHGGQHHAIDCYNSGQDFTIYLHDNYNTGQAVTGCGGNSNGGKTGALYVECGSQASLAQVGEKSFEEPVGANLAQETKGEGAAYLRQQFAKDSFPICRRQGPHLTSPDACGCAQCLWSGTCWPNWDQDNCNLYQGTWNCAGQVTPQSLGLVQPVVQPKYYVMEAGTCCCPEYSKIKSENECREAIQGVGILSMTWSGENQDLPSGCSAQYGSNGYFNTGNNFDARGDMLPICSHAFGPAATPGAQFYRMPLGATECQASHRISSVEECVGAAGALGLIVVSLEAPWKGESAGIPVGCSHQYGGRAHWNSGASGAGRQDMLPMCARPPTEDLTYFRMPPGHQGCDAYEAIHSIEECKAAAAAVGFDTNTAQTVWEGISSAIPLSCSGQLGGRPHYNYDSVGGKRADIFPICKRVAVMNSLAEIHTEIQQETTSFYPLHAGAVGCPENQQVGSFDECKTASKNLGFNSQFGIVADNTSEIPGGCSAQRWGKTTWNTHQTGGSHSDSIPICKEAAPLPVP